LVDNKARTTHAVSGRHHDPILGKQAFGTVFAQHLIGRGNVVGRGGTLATPFHQ
jgi:hypothetical protein